LEKDPCALNNGKKLLWWRKKWTFLIRPGKLRKMHSVKRPSVRVRVNLGGLSTARRNVDGAKPKR